MGWRWYVILALALARPGVAADTPTVRPLDSEPAGTPTPGAEEPARTLPPSVAVCHEPGGSRCWTRPLAEDCASEGGRVFRVVLGDANGRDAAAALAQCEAAAAAITPRPMPKPR
jgi:hypothetical protein